jgi:superfamily II DNA helicase RecQ
LRHLATVRPTTREALMEIHGIGEQKIEAYGADLLAELASMK